MAFELPQFRVIFRVSSFLTLYTIFLSANLAAQAHGNPQISKRASEASTCSADAHAFWDRKNILLLSGVAATRILDYSSTQNMLARGREERLIPDDVVKNKPGFAALEAAGTATSIGISYLLHRTGHHRLERWMSIGHIGVTAFGAARNYALESRHP